MRRVQWIVAILVSVSVSPVLHSTTSFVVPTTTLAAQTGNNTSAARTFTTQANGNRGAGNISKVDVHSLLYAGTTTKVYAHLMLWFGPANHMNVGYTSDDATQIHNQITDMISRGIDGVIIDWYGPNNAIDDATKLVMAEAEQHPGFTVALMVDQGGIAAYSCSGCTAQQALIDQLQYAEQTYFTSPAYLTSQGQPVITNFDIDRVYTIDWNAVNAALSTHPVFLFQDNSGFSHTLSGGSYSWVKPTTSDYGMSYVSSFYDTGILAAAETTVGAGYKGFNDTLAAWGSNRIMNQQCGQTWLQTFSEINGLYNSGRQLTDLQLVTWNDYEEASEIESGIDNCVTVASSVAADALQWTVQGDESTVDHYTVYISADGQNLMPLANLAAGVHALDLCSFSMPTSTYQLFTQAVGKPTLANQITSAVSYTPSCTSNIPPPTVTLGASPMTLSMVAGESANLTIIAQTLSGSLNTPITLSCAGVWSALSCSFSPTTVTPGSGTATSVLTISSVAVRRTKPAGPPRRLLPMQFGWLLPIGFVGFAFAGSVPRKRRVQALLLLVLAMVSMGTFSCGRNTFVSQNPVASLVVPAGHIAPVVGNYSVTIQGDYSSSHLSAVVSVAVH